MNKNDYGIIREQGEFMDIKPLTDEENDIVNEKDDSSEETKQM